MIPLIQARRQFIPPAETIFTADQIDNFSLSSSGGTTRSSLDIGATGSTRQYWLGCAVSTANASSTTAVVTATLGGNSFTPRRTYNRGTVVGSVHTVVFLSLEDYDGETEADLVVSSSATIWGGFVLLRLSKVNLSSHDNDILGTNNAGTYPFTTNIPDEGILWAAGCSSSTGGNNITGPDNVVYTNQTFGHSRNRHAIAWHSSQFAESLGNTYFAGSQTSDAHMYIAESFGPAA